jgi:hypothetical protein
VKPNGTRTLTRSRVAGSALNTSAEAAFERIGACLDLRAEGFVTELQLSAAWRRRRSVPSSLPKPTGSPTTPPLGLDRLRGPAAASRPLVVPIARQYPTVSTETRHRSCRRCIAAASVWYAAKMSLARVSY